MVIIIGGTGILGKELQKYFKHNISLNSEWDIYKFKKLKNLLDKIKPSLILNCAAIKSEEVDRNPTKSINVNIIGSANLSKYCIENDIRLVYISTDYVYSGIDGDHKETDPILPQNNYAWTKLAGEVPVMLVPNHLIVRVSFGESIFPYKNAFTNLFVSKDYVDVIAPLIAKVAFSEITGVINVGTQRKSIYDYAVIRNPQVIPSQLDCDKDFSLNLGKLNSLYNNVNTD